MAASCSAVFTRDRLDRGRLIAPLLTTTFLIVEKKSNKKTCHYGLSQWSSKKSLHVHKIVFFLNENRSLVSYPYMLHSRHRNVTLSWSSKKTWFTERLFFIHQRWSQLTSPRKDITLTFWAGIYVVCNYFARHTKTNESFSFQCYLLWSTIVLDSASNVPHIKF